MDRKSKNGWTKIPAAILDCSGLSWKGEWVWIVLAWHTRPDRPACWPSLQTLSQWAGLSEWAVRQGLEELERARLLVIESSSYRSKFYRPLIPPGRWIAIPNTLLADEVLSVEDKLVYIHLFKDLPRRKRLVSRRQTELAEEMSRLIPGFTRRRVQLALERLEDSHYITSTWGDRRKPKGYSPCPFLGEPPQLVGDDVQQAVPDQNGKNPASRPHLSHDPPPRSHAVAPRSDADFHHKIEGAVCNSVQQDIADQNCEIPASGPPLSQLRSS